MSIKRILITGDDGYNSVGIRSLIRLLKDKYSLSVAATLNQQSGVGGKMTLADELPWGEEKIDGVPILWVDGSPVDAVEVAQGYYKKHFDVVISGINFGENVAHSLVSSGTFSAAVRAVGINLAPHAVVLSWQTALKNILKKHKIGHDISEFLKYPGKQATKTIEMIFQNDFYGKALVNINFPMEPSKKYKIVKVAKDITKLWKYPMLIDRKRKVARPPSTAYSDHLETDISTDSGALHKGYITISPLNYLE